MKKRTKALIGILTATSLTVAAVSMMFIHNHEADAKNASFNGIGSIIKSSTEENPFTVVELVPDEKMAKFGYFVEGSEPEDWRDNLAKLRTKNERINYMNGLHNRLSSISASDRTKPLTYTEYKEAYSLDGVPAADEAKYSSFDLATPIEIKKGTVIPYKMVDAAGGSFKLEATFKEQAGGDYDENAVSYEYTENLDGKYAVKFKKADLSNPDGSIVYRASEIREFHNADEVKVLGFTRYIYRKAKGATGTNVVYEYALSNKDANGYSFDFANYDYVLLSFEGVDVSTLTAAERTSGVYYSVESAEYLGGEAEFNGVLNNTEPYKKVTSGQGHFAVSSEEGYVFVGKGNGSKKLVEAASEALKHDLFLDKVFYTGGFKNNNWFENGVFLKNFSDNNYLSTTNPDYNSEKMKIKVVTLTPAGIKAALAANPNYFSNVGLLYIVGSNSLVDGFQSYKYTAGNDINPDVLNAIKYGVDTNNLPVVIENYGTAYRDEPNMYALAIELISNRKYFKGVADADGHFVKKSVYVIEQDYQGQTPEIFKNFASDFINEKTSDSAFVKKAKEVGFGEVAESIVEENDFVDMDIEGTTDNTKKFTLEISKARVLEYIISYKMRRQRTTDDVVKILDIEPAKVAGQKEKDSDRIKEKVTKWLAPNGNTVTQTSITMPTTEFIGKNDELSSYDLIYMGLDVSNFNTVTERRSVFKIVPSKNMPPERKEGEWITERIVSDIHKADEVIHGRTVTIPGTSERYTIPDYTIPAHTIPKTTEVKSVNGRNYYWRPAYNIPAYNIPGYKVPVSPYWKDVKDYTVYNDVNMNGLVYSNVGDIYQDIYFNNGQSFLGGILDTDYMMVGDLISRYNRLMDKNGTVEESKKSGIKYRYAKQYENTIKEKYINIEAYKDAVPNASGIRLNYKEGMKESDYHFEGVYDNKASSDWLSYRFPGNDITEDKLRKLKEYIEAGGPIVFADGFVNRQGGTITVNDEKIDNSSRMYELVGFAIDFRNRYPSKKNVIFEGADETLPGNELNAFITNINLPKPEIMLEKQEYEKDKDIESRLTDFTTINNKTLEINFKLLNKGFESENAKFKLSFYIDSNGDGKFSGTKEMVNKNLYKVLKDNAVHKGELTASKTSWYKVSYKLPEYFVGVVSWKIKVELITKNGSKRDTSATGMGHVENTGEPKKVNILQIKTTGYLKNKLNQHYKNDDRLYKYNNDISFIDLIERNRYLNNGEKDEDLIQNVPRAAHIAETTFDMSTNFSAVDKSYLSNKMRTVLGDTNRVVNELLKKVKDFDINIDSVEGYDYMEKYDNWWKKNKGSKRPEEFFDEFPYENNKTKQYDMLIIGFADSYKIDNEKGCLEAIQGFMNSGKPVLMTHDATSSINYRGTGIWNYEFTRMFRDKIGLDRYGILSNWALRVGTGADKNDKETKYYQDFFPTIKENISENSLTSSKLYEIATKNAQMDPKHKKDIAYKPRSNKTIIVKEAQGVHYGALLTNNYLNFKDNQMEYVNSQRRIFKNINPFMSSDRIEQINAGQITTYPFKIEEKFDIAETHYQPYQLDFSEDEDEDGEGDMVVWYTLMSPKSKMNETYNGYNVDPRSVRNNYYIYSKGNITYSGVGHKPITSKEEIKLYINTVIAAYKAALVPPSIEFKESGNPDAAETKVSYISYDVSSDAKNNGAVTGDKVKVYFTPVDHNELAENIIRDRTRILVKPMSPNGVPYKVYTYDGVAMSYLSDAKYGMCYYLTPGERYYFEVPLSELGGNKNKIEIKVFAKSRLAKENNYTNTTKIEYSPEVTSTYIVQKRGLFDLD